MDEAGARALLAQAPVARLATVRDDGRPHIVPCVFALDDEQLYTPVDRKPKRTTALQRLRNIEHEPRVALLVDGYQDAWEQLWWVRVDGRARIEDAGAAWARGIELLAAKYRQYADEPPDDRIVVITIERVTGWRWSGS